MPVDASIYSQLQPQQAPNPLASLAQAYQIRAMQEDSARAQRVEDQQNRLMQLVGSQDFQSLDPNAKASRLQSIGAFDQAGKVITSAAAANKDQRAADQSQLEGSIKRYEAMSGALMELSKNPSQAPVMLKQLVDGGIMLPEYAQKVLQGAANSSDPAGFFLQGARASISAKDQQAQMLQAQQQALTIRGQDLTRQTSLENNASTNATTRRGQDLSAATSRANNADTIATTRRGQDLTDAARNNKALNDTQAKALQFGTRMQIANEELDSLASQGVEQPGLIKRAAEKVGLGVPANYTQSAPQQRVEQAQRDFINAVLRRESGAAIAESEFNNARQQYFPQPGDTPEVIAQKKQNREVAMRGILAEVPDAETRVAQVRGSSKPAGSGAPMSVTNAADYAKVPSGATYTTPDGKTRRKP